MKNNSKGKLVENGIVVSNTTDKSESDNQHVD